MAHFSSLTTIGMNETDVRETIVRPLLAELGYEFGTSANIRTEVPLRYSKFFLGRKNASKDPDLRGRADYICEVIPHARFAVEVKRPDADLTAEDSFQAYTYAAHPEIAATYYMLANGNEFQLFRFGDPSTPILEWRLEDCPQILPSLAQIVGPEALRKGATAHEVALGNPLAHLLGSSARIVGGVVTYMEHHAAHPMVEAALQQQMGGLRSSVLGNRVFRTESGLIRAELKLAPAFAAMDMLNKAAGLETFDFETADDRISEDVEAPSIFQNLVRNRLPRGTMMGGVLGIPTTALPFDVDFSAYTEAVGFLDGSSFKGTFSIQYDYRSIIEGPATFQLQQMAALFDAMSMSSAGGFEIQVA